MGPTLLQIGFFPVKMDSDKIGSTEVVWAVPSHNATGLAKANFDPSMKK